MPGLKLAFITSKQYELGKVVESLQAQLLYTGDNNNNDFDVLYFLMKIK